MKDSVLVLGAGRSGIEAAHFILGMGQAVILYDGDETKDPAAVRKQLENEGGIESTAFDRLSFILGELKREALETMSYAVISPGIPLDAPFLSVLTEADVPVISEIELGYRYEKGEVIGITGTNGKTTTTSLVGAIMQARLTEEGAFIAGNIGIPYTREVVKSTEKSVSVLELSSFQLETIRDFHPHVSAILNITPDHLNRHHTMENYEAAKERITMNQTADDFCVLNYDDPRLRTFAENCPARVIFFSSREALADGYFLADGSLYYSLDGEPEHLIDTKELNLVGRCNYENVLAAIACCEAMCVPRDLILETVRTFKAVPHRIEFVAEKNGVRYYNDSKGTNPDAAIQGILAMERPTVLIGGGYDKGSEYDDWVRLFPGRVKKLILIGATKEKIAECCEKYGFRDYVFKETFKDAFYAAKSYAESGDAVLLSPACASWGMFNNYEERGDLFKELTLREEA